MGGSFALHLGCLDHGRSIDSSTLTHTNSPFPLPSFCSAKGENSYAHQNDLELGVALVDRFTDATCDYVHQLADRIAPHRPGTSGSPQLLPRVREYLEQVCMGGKD